MYTGLQCNLRAKFRELVFNEIGAGFARVRSHPSDMSKRLALVNLLFFLVGLTHLFDPLFVEPWKA